MNKDVTIKIKGMQKYPEGERVETVTETSGEYFFRNGSHFVKFEEEVEGFTEVSKCLLKVKEDYVEMTKKGLVDSHMIFEKDKCHRTQYKTPFGVIMMGMQTKHIHMMEEENALAIQIEYELNAEEEHMADCSIRIMVKSRN